MMEFALNQGEWLAVAIAVIFAAFIIKKVRDSRNKDNTGTGTGGGGGGDNIKKNLN